MLRKNIHHSKAEPVKLACTVGIGLVAGDQVTLLTDTTGMVFGGADGGGAGGTAPHTEILRFLITHSGPRRSLLPVRIGAEAASEHLGGCY